jgi:cytochrome b561
VIFNTLYYWGTPAKLLHWIGAAMILSLYFHGLVIEEWFAHDKATEATQLHLHAATGATLGLLMLGRFLWRVINKIPMLPAKTPEWEKRIAGYAHLGLYVATFVALVSGWLASGARNPAVEVKLFGLVPIPTLEAFSDKPTRELLDTVHELSAHALLIIVALHVFAALWHHYVQKDSVLRRMWLRGQNRQRQR